jgi:hypothetical protein
VGDACLPESDDHVANSIHGQILPVHPVHKTRKLVLQGGQGGNSGKGGKQRIAFIHVDLELCCLVISDLQKWG